MAASSCVEFVSVVGAVSVVEDGENGVEVEGEREEEGDKDETEGAEETSMAIASGAFFLEKSEVRSGMRVWNATIGFWRGGEGGVKEQARKQNEEKPRPRQT